MTGADEVRAVPASLRILVVEDEPNDAELMAFQLRREGLAFSCERVETEEEYVARLGDPPDVILADYRLPRFGALRALALLRERRLDVPFLVVTGDAREAIAVECMKAGASDFLVKDRLALLGTAVSGALEAKRLRDDEAKAEAELRDHRERLEEIVKERTAQLLRSERRAQLVRDVALAANAARTLGDVLLVAIRRIADHWAWPVGHAWILDGATGRFADSGHWHVEDRSRYAGFLAASAASDLGAGDGFFRGVLASGLPTWLPIPSPLSLFVRGEAARESGLGFVCAAPVKVREKVFAILEFLGDAAQRPAEDDLELLMQVGHQIGVSYDRFQAEAELLKLSVAVTQSPATVMVTDRDGRIQYVNPAFETTTGYRAADALGQTPRILRSGVHPVAFHEELWGTILKGETWRGELCNRRKDGKFYWESASISSLRNETGEITGFVAVKLDVTDRKEAERQLELATEEAEKASRAKSIFLANMSHEIRTPLNAVLGFSQLMMDDAGLTPRQREHLASINVNGEHLLALINDVLAMSKIEAGRTTLQVNSVDLSGLLDDVERMFRLRAEEKRLAFEVQRSGALPRWVLADETKLRQILVNLLGNSMKFTRQGGIVVRARAVPSAESAFRLVVDVEDTGAGIAEEDLPRLFEHFEQARSGGPPAGGTGLGLAISRAFARQMGGEITVRSRPGVGSAFTLEVDLVAEEHEVEPLVTPSGRIRSLAKGVGPRRVLVVDDVEANRQVAALMLERVGFDVRTAGDGPGAISAFRAWKPHLVLMDLRMPGMDGLEAIRRIRSLDGGGMLPIIALTASAFEEDRREVLAAGGTDFVGKPFREPDLLRKVGDALGIRYDREETGPGESARSPETFPPIPESLRTELRTAVVRADLDQVRHLAAALEREAPLAAGMVRALADQFEYGKLLEAIDRSDAGG